MNLYGRFSILRRFVWVLVAQVFLAWLPPANGAAPAAEMGTSVVILEFHGMKQGVIAKNLKNLPHFRELINGPSDCGAYTYLPRVLTTVPGGSVPDITAMYTGVYPRKTGIVSTTWFDRKTAKTRNPLSYSQQRINNILRRNHVKTIFDYLHNAGGKSMTAMLMVTKGSDWSLKSGVFFWGNAATLGFLRNRRWIPDSSYIDRKTLSAFLSGHLMSYHKSLEGVFQRYHAIPDLMALEFLGTDLISHYPPADLRKRCSSIAEIQGAYAIRVLDPLVGKLIRFLNKTGRYETTVFFLISDHGFSRILKHVRDKAVDESLRKVFSLPGWRTSEQSADAVIMPGASTKDIYLKNRSTRNWMDPPRLLGDVKPAIDLLLEKNELRDCLNALVIWQYPGERNEGPLETRDQWWVFDWRDYLADGKHKGNTAFVDALRPLSAIKKSFTLYDYVMRGLQMQYTRETTPDIKLINKKGYYFEPDRGKYGHHGSYYRDDCLVSFWIAGPGLARIIPGRHVLTRTASVLDLAPMVLHILGIPVPPRLDGSDPLATLNAKAVHLSSNCAP